MSKAYGNNPKILADRLDEELGGVTNDIQGLSNVVSAYLSGGMSDEALEEQLESVTQSGSDEMDRRGEAYQDSPDADREYAAANDIIQAVNSNENKLMDILAEVRRISSGLGTGGGIQGLVATFGESLLTATLSSLISGGGLSGLGSLAQKVLKPVMGMDIFTKTAPALAPADVIDGILDGHIPAGDAEILKHRAQDLGLVLLVQDDEGGGVLHHMAVLL